jgi:integrase
LTKEEVARIVAACEIQREKCRGPIYSKTENGRRLRAFVLALLYTGMRIGDVTALERARVQNGKLFLYTQKTGTPVYLPLPEFVLMALEQAPVINERYYFRSGNGKLKSAVADCRGPWLRFMRLLVCRTHMPIGFKTHLPWNFYSLACPWSAFRYCWAIRA